MLSEESDYICSPLKVKDSDQIATILTDWANRSELCYKLSFPVYNESLTEGTLLLN